jgi:hypothetical protein
MSDNKVWRDRVKEFRRIASRELLANPKNWREHPSSQKKALTGLLDEVGIAGALLARETPDGLELIDGHLRKEVDPDTEWPVLVLDVNEEEADLLLTMTDPIAAMADTNKEALEKLVGSITTDNESIESVLSDLSESYSDAEEEKYTRKVEAPVYVPTGLSPCPSDLYDKTSSSRLVSDIMENTEPGDVRDFLLAAAQRHTSFRYDLIAEFYANSDPTIQRLMEASALVIVDVDSAIEHGFLSMTEELQRLVGR